MIKKVVKMSKKLAYEETMVMCLYITDQITHLTMDSRTKTLEPRSDLYVPGKAIAST